MSSECIPASEPTGAVKLSRRTELLLPPRDLQMRAATPATPDLFAVRLRERSRQRSVDSGTMRNAQVGGGLDLVT
jgi:hypothetical protein